MSTWAIGEVAKLTGVPAKTIRYYEDAGLIAPATRADNGYRVFGERSVHTLRFIKRARDLGFSMKAVSELLALWDDDTRESAEVRSIAKRHLDSIERKIAELEGLRDTLNTLVHRCHGDDRPDCPILEELAAPPST